MLQGLTLLLAVGSAHLGWVEDNYSKVLAEAKSRHMPIFVEVWAPW